MLYKFDKDSLLYKKISKVTIFLSVLIIITLMSFLFFAGCAAKKAVYIESESQQYILTTEDSFNKEKLIEKIKELNFRFPYIVYSQAVLESGNFNSVIFKENNNLFGMKQAAVRINTAKGTNKNHAYYDSWEDSLLDYALYSATYLHRISTEEQYIEYLGKSYAEDRMYGMKIRDLVRVFREGKLF